MQINFKKELERLKHPVWKTLKGYLPEKYPLGHYEIVRDYPERQGKYFRPALLLLSVLMHSGKMEDALLTAAAMQASEDWLLIHDDFEDHSEYRRGKPCLNKIYSDELAVNGGDALHIIMWKILGDAAKNLGNEIGWKVFDKMNDILLATTEGQFMELDWIAKKRVYITKEEYYKMIYIKAGYYTITGPLQLGATIARASDEEIKKIENWGAPFGLAFQIWDDIMNLSVSSGAQGKEQGGDILEGKRTLILIHLLQNCSLKEKRDVEKIYLKQRREKTEDEKEYVLKLMREYDSINMAKKKAREFAKSAMEIFVNENKHLKNCGEADVIKAGIEFTVNRDC